MSTCKDAIDLMLEYLDGGLPPDIKGKLEEHLGGCSPCDEFLATYKATPTLCRKALQKQMPEKLAARLMDFLRENAAKP